jgi:hypothetical protein
VLLTDEEIADLSPAAAAASALIKSGVSLTGIYREHCKVVDELEMKKLEYNQMHAYFEELVQVGRRPGFPFHFVLSGDRQEGADVEATTRGLPPTAGSQR